MNEYFSFDERHKRNVVCLNEVPKNARLNAALNIRTAMREAAGDLGTDPISQQHVEDVLNFWNKKVEHLVK